MRKGFVFKLILLIFTVLILLFVYNQSLGVKQSKLVNGASFERTDCWFETSLFPLGIQPQAFAFGFKFNRVECGYLTTRKDQGRSYFRLPVVILRDSLWRNSPDPVLNVAGGPGSSAWLDEETINQFWLPLFKSNDWHHDLVLFDARGTGQSQPSLHCDSFFEQSIKILEQELSPEEEVKQTYLQYQTCHQQLQQDPQQSEALQHLGTIQNTQDIADLADLLDIKHWHLYGTSYGTRLALEVARLYPDKVASLILDSVYPQEIDGEQVMPDLFIDAVEKIVMQCSEDPTCALQYSNLDVKLERVMQKLRRQPLTLQLEYDNKKLSIVVTAARFYSLLYDAGYDISTIVRVPNVIQSLYGGKDDALKELAQNSLDMLLDPSFSNPVYMEVECNENEIRDLRAHREKILKRYVHYPSLKRWQLAAIKDDFCNVWGANEIADSFHNAVITDKPSMILAGSLDSATPPEWGKGVASRLPNSQYHEFKASGHGVLFNVACAKSLVRAFLNPDNDYPAACQSTDQFVNGQRIAWEAPDVGDVFQIFDSGQ